MTLIYAIDVIISIYDNILSIYDNYTVFGDTYQKVKDIRKFSQCFHYSNKASLQILVYISCFIIILKQIYKICNNFMLLKLFAKYHFS